MTRRLRALARYSLAGALRTPYVWAAATLLLGMAMLGLYSSAVRGLGWRLSPSFLADGALLAAVVGLRSGLIDQRVSGARTFLRMNLMSPTEHMAGLTLSLLGLWLLLCCSLFGLAVTLPGGGPRVAMWETWVFVLRTLPLLPFVLVVESVTDIQLPFFVPALLWLCTVLVLVAFLGEEQTMAVMSPPVRYGDYGSTLPRVWRAGSGPAGFAMILAATRAVSGRR